MEKAGVEHFTIDTLKTLNLYINKHGYNNVAAIFADENQFPGIDIAVFGADISIIKKRETYNHCSILKCFENAINTIKVVLPVINETSELSSDQQIIYKLLSDKRSFAISDSLLKCDFSKSKVTKILKELYENELIKIEGRGRGTKYRLR